MSTFQYRPAIDGLRALAVVAVLLFHLDPDWLPGGFIGVDIFFVISGYLITSIILRDCEKGTYSLVHFYQRRIARIFPAFFTVAIVTLIGASFVYSPQDYASAGANFAASTLSIANVKFMFQGNYFEISPDAQPYLHCWSLSLEEQFYLFFPLLFLLVFKFLHSKTLLIFGVIGIISLALCLVMTPLKPVWAFYLLPTRGWELIAGCSLAIFTAKNPSRYQALQQPWVPILGMLMIIASLIFVREGPTFPGWQAILPVLGTVMVLVPVDRSAPGYVETFLSKKLLVAIGGISYSLYLWHWPIYSLIDYQLLLESFEMRLSLKIGLTLLVAYLSYRYIENPARSFLNKPKSRRLAYGAFASLIIVCASLGFSIRKANYVNATQADVAKGGLVYPQEPSAPSVILIGDSNGSMYGKLMKELCSDLGYNLTVLSVAGGNALPDPDGKNSNVWRDSLEIVKNEQPDYLVMANLWTAKLKKTDTILTEALDSLRPHVGKLVILNQPPLLPDTANRKAIRSGARPPFIEDSKSYHQRTKVNTHLATLADQNTLILDVASYFEAEDMEVLFLDQKGRQLYHDRTHLSGHGADRVEPTIRSALSRPE